MPINIRNPKITDLELGDGGNKVIDIKNRKTRLIMPGMTSNTTVISSEDNYQTFPTIYGNPFAVFQGTYNVTASTDITKTGGFFSQPDAWRGFASEEYAPSYSEYIQDLANSNYNTTTFQYEGTDNLTGNYAGAWFKIELPNPFALYGINIGQTPEASGSLGPTDWQLVGSNDDTNWTVIHTMTGATQAWKYLNETTSYKYYAISFSKVYLFGFGSWSVHIKLYANKSEDIVHDTFISYDRKTHIMLGATADTVYPRPAMMIGHNTDVFGVGDIQGNYLEWNGPCLMIDNDVSGINTNIYLKGPSNSQQKINFNCSGADVWSAGVDYNTFKIGYGDDGGFATGNLNDNTKLQITTTNLSIPSGNVGIGTTNPLNKLHLDGRGNASTTNILISSDGENSSYIKFKEGVNANVGFDVGYNGSTNNLEMISENGGTENVRMTINRDTGNVGIGTISPSTTLHVRDSNTSINTIFNMNIDVAIISTTYYPISRIDAGSGGLKLSGLLGGHQPTQGRTNVNLGFWARDNFEVMGVIIGDLNLQDIVVYNNNGVYTLYIKATNYCQANLELQTTRLANYQWNGSGSTTIPTGTLVFSAKDNIGATNIMYHTRSGHLDIYQGAYRVSNSNLTTHPGTDGSFYRYGGQVYIEVDDNLYIKDVGNNTLKLQFDTNNGRLAIGKTGPGCGLHIKQLVDDDGGDLYHLNRSGIIIERAGNANTWSLSVNTHDDFTFCFGLSARGWLNNTGNNDMLNFTGQHRTQMNENNEEILININNYVGLIVSSIGEYIQQKVGNNSYIINGIDINEALPKIKLTEKDQDKSVFGVISNGEDLNNNLRTYSMGVWVSASPKEEGDNRIIINSIGEGGIWVCNVNGSFENGDYITTTSLAPGYGVKQESEFLANYTVAKITQNEDFSDMTNGRVLENGIKCKFVGCTYHCG